MPVVERVEPAVEELDGHAELERIALAVADGLDVWWAERDNGVADGDRLRGCLAVYDEIAVAVPELVGLAVADGDGQRARQRLEGTEAKEDVTQSRLLIRQMITELEAVLQVLRA